METSANPPKELYIYYLKGLLPPSFKISWKGFLGNWQEDGFSFLFFSQPAPNQIEKILTSQPRLTFIDKYHMSYKEWHGSDFEPLQIGGFLIVPPWALSDGNTEGFRDLRPVILDPGVVFGTGTHPTTAMCAAMIEKHLKKGDRFLDVGTGSGILMITAARLGAGRVCGIDRDETAVKIAAANLKLNSIQPRRFQVTTANLVDEIRETYDMIAANIFTHVILDLLAGIKRVLNPGGIFVCSGIIEKNKDQVIGALRAIGFEPVEIAAEEEWAAITSRRTA